MKSVLLFLLFISFTSISQTIVTSRRSSYYTFIYKITNEEARQLYLAKRPEPSTFHHLRDFYPTDSTYKKELPTGHYLIVSTVNDELHYELRSIDNTSLHILNNQRDLILTVSDSSGNAVKNAQVKVGRRHIGFTENNAAYVLAKANRQGLVEIQYRGHSSFFQLERRYNNTFFVRTGKRIISVFPINHLASIIIYPIHTVKRLVDGNNVQPPGIYYRVRRLFESRYDRNLPGYVAFNKPMYKPGDTLKLKANFTKRNGKPNTKPLDLRLYSYGNISVNKKLGQIKPYRPGAYVFELVLHDSLKLALDTNPSIYFEIKDRHITSKGFRYEQYELKGNRYAARADNKETYKPATLYLKGTDTNDLPLYDVSTEILIMPQQVTDIYKSNLFVADTLWFHQQKLDPIGETKIAVPDSILPNAALKYKAIISFLNAENERQTKEQMLAYEPAAFPIRMKVSNDSVVFTSWKNEVIAAEIAAVDKDDKELYVKEVSFPYREKINPLVAEYQVGDHKKWDFFPMKELDELSVLANRAADSVVISVENPHGIEFHYQIFKNRQLIYRGHGNKSGIILTRKSGTSGLYTAAVQYMWAGEPKNENYTVPFNNRSLTVSISHAPLVYPGQQAEFSVLVKDAFGKPVQDADVTALAVTKKFTQPTYHQVPTFPKKQKQRRIFNQFNIKEFEELEPDKLEWLIWNKKLGLDSIEFYKFLYPDNGKYSAALPSSDTITQVSPYVVQKGKVLQPAVIYLNNQPVYYDAVNTYQPYSFRAPAGKNKIEIRLPRMLLTLPEVEVRKGHRLIFSVNVDHPSANIQRHEMPEPFTEHEKEKLSRYFVNVIRASKQSEAYIKQGDTYFNFPVLNNFNNRPELVGPLYPQLTSFVVKNDFTRDFSYEPFYSYQFDKNLIRQRELSDPLKFTYYKPRTFQPNFSQLVVTPLQIQQQWQAVINQSPRLYKRYPTEYTTGKNTGRLAIFTNAIRTKSAHVCTFMINLDNPDQYFIYPATHQNFDLFDPGKYEVVLLYEDARYLRSDAFELKPFGQTYLDFRTKEWKAPDGFSNQLMETLRTWADKSTYVEQARRQEMQDVRASYYTQSNQSFQYYSNAVTGQVTSSDDGIPLPGVNVLVKGTTMGTVTDINGIYTIGIPPSGELVFSFIGMKTEQINVGNRNNVDVSLEADVMQLSEVVVVGYGAQYKRELTASVASVSSNALSGRVAGVSITGNAAADTISIRVRGANSLVASSNLLVVIDGVVYNASKFNELDPNLITAIETLNADNAVALYGVRAANGVILISTKKGVTSKQLLETKLPDVVLQIPLDGNLPGSSLRKNFRDYAFWQPRLVTDAKGKATFKATFPDDITGWKAEALVVASKKRTGQGQSTIQSFKPLLAQLAVPQFLIEGDSAMAIGKITNYTSDEITLQRSIQTIAAESSETLTIKNSYIDSLRLTTQGLDSVSTKYSVTYSGYEDGELRKIPVYRKGVKEAEGIFLTLRNDTTFVLSANADPIKIYVQADLLDVLLDEIESVRSYSYECNEQLASKLKVLLAEKKIKEFKKESFTHSDRVRKIIRRLQDNQHKNGGWGWWNQSEGDEWITLHVAQALERAREEKFDVRFDDQGVINFLEKDLFRKPLSDQLEPLIYLATHGVKTNPKPLIDSLQKNEDLSVHQRLKLFTLMQETAVPWDKEWLTKSRQQTIKGNYYWGEPANALFGNDIQCTLLAYQLQEQAGASADELSRVRNFFLEKRLRYWRNTYESAKIIATILPGLLKDNTAFEKTTLAISGAVRQQIEKFPFQLEITTGQSVTLSKKGASPVYFTAYREYWNSHPERSEKDFIVNTSFEHSTQNLTTGKPIKLFVDVVVKKDAEYVMIEVPIPAGCSYETKAQSRNNGEVHRESFYDKTSIFCKNLKAGTYRYEVSLVPRYKGSYTLNPARAELMYFPLMYGREGIKKIMIASK
ncbi:MAG: carboxypeptidase-like regulatory domain-containing protein [bacterium]